MNTPLPHQFDSANARTLCLLSAQAYQPPASAEESVLWNQETDTHVLLSRHSALPPPEGGGDGARDRLIAFRGTADLRNWLTDLDCELVRVGKFRVHRGFLESMEAVESDLDGLLAGENPARLWLTGHSLGGALAKLFALWALERGHAVAGVYTFGQPRVGDADFARHYDSLLKPQTFRVVHADDIVPRVPWLLARYRHAAHEIFFPSVPSVPLVDLPWPRKLPYAIPALIREATQKKLPLLDDHHVSRYLALFNEARPAARVSSSCSS
jgi:triacylglycerol lipase